MSNPNAQQPQQAPLDHITIRQRLALTVNRYEVRAGGDDGPVIAIAQQKRMALKEKVTFYADEAKTTPLFGFGARQVMDLAATYDITDANGAQLGLFKKDFKSSLLRSTWNVEVPFQGIRARGQERNEFIAILRRFTDFSWPIHFDFVTENGESVYAVQRTWALRDVYRCPLPMMSNGQRLDWRVAACLTIACDALMAR